MEIVMEIVIVLVVLSFFAVIAGIISKLGNSDCRHDHVEIDKNRATAEKLDLLYEHLGLRTSYVPEHTEVVKIEPLESLDAGWIKTSAGDMEYTKSSGDKFIVKVPKSNKKRG